MMTMAGCMNTLVQILMLLTVFLQYITISSGLVHNLETNEDVLEFRAENGTQGILYYHHVGPTESFRSRTKSLMESIDPRLQGYPSFMKFAAVNCSIAELKDNECCKGKGKRKFFAYKPNHDPERFSLRTLHDVDSFISQMIYFVYQHEISIIEDMNDWENHQNMMKGKKDLIFMYFQGLGSHEHYSYMIFFLKVREQMKYEFTFSNSEEVAVQLGKQPRSTSTILFSKCAMVKEDSTDGCPTEVIGNTAYMDEEVIRTFVELQSLPKVTEINGDGSTVYDALKHTHILYLFAEEDQIDMVKEMAHNVIAKCKSSAIQLRVAIADRRNHGKMMEETFGITEDTMLPTAMLKINVGNKADVEVDVDVEDPADMRVVEPFTPDEDFVEDSLLKFIENVVLKSDQYFKSVADVYYIDCIESKDWKGPSNMKRDTLIGVCSSNEEHKEHCLSFNQDFRRLVRSMHTAGLLNLDFIYIDVSTVGELHEFADIPALALVLKGKMIPYTNGMNFDDVLEWISGHFKVNLLILPVSGSDLQHLSPRQKLNENAALEYDESDTENLMKYQEDEVSMVASKLRSSRFYEDGVLQLTDKTFEKTLNMTELLLVLFYTPEADDISFLVQPIFDAVSTEIGKDTSTNMIPAKVSKLNCEHHYLACKPIHVFPTIRFYSKGKILGTYRGLLEPKSILKALRLYQQPYLQKLSDDSILEYQEPSPGNIGSSSLSILGWFTTENEDFQVYKKVAGEYRGRMRFAYATGEPSSKLLPEMPKSSFVAAYMGGKTSRVLSGDINSFTEMELREFMKIASIPKFGELTMSNFPVYKSFNKPLLVLFIPSNKKSESIAWQVISQVVKDNSLENHVFFTWMDTDNSVTKDIRRSYLGTRKEKQDIVIVNHTKGEVYHYTGTQDYIDGCAQELALWIQKCASGEIMAKSYLKTMKWKPLREGFDFLHLIDTNQIRAGLSEEEYEKQVQEDMREEEEGSKPGNLFGTPKLTEQSSFKSNSEEMTRNEGEDLDKVELADVLNTKEENIDEFAKAIDMGKINDETEEMLAKLAMNNEEMMNERDEL